MAELKRASFFDRVKDYFRSAYNLTAERRGQLRMGAAWFGAGVLAVVLLSALLGATTSQDADNPAWELVILARLFLARLTMAAAVSVVLVALAVVLWNFLDNTKVGERLWLWRDDQPEWLRQAKARNGGLIFAAFLVALGVLLAGAIR